MRLFQLFVVTLKLMSVNCVYKKVGDQVALMPNYTKPITSITWKHGLDIAMEWTGGQVESYQQFQDRGMLNTSTGVMIITGLTLGESSNYTVDINNKPVDTVLLQVIYPVPKPHVSRECDPRMTSCVFTCECNTTNAEPITYKWSIGDTVGPSGKVLKMTKEEGEQLWKNLHCALENPVSSSYSETLDNPFITRDRKWLLTCLIPVVVVGVMLLVCALKRCQGTDDSGTL